MYTRIIPLLLLAFVLIACGGGDEDFDTPTTAAEAQEMANEMTTRQMESLQEGKEREDLTTDDLKAMFPDQIDGMEHGEIDASAVGAMGFTVANASATYEDPDSRKRISVNITDGMGGNLPGMSMLNSMTVDREEGSKTTKTLTVNGHKAVREWDSDTKRGQLSVIHDQSLVVIEGRNLDDADELEVVYAALDLGKL